MSSQAEQMLRSEGVWLQNGHYIGTQGDQPGRGLHMTDFIDKDMLSAKPRLSLPLANELANYARKASFAKCLSISCVVGMPMGAITLGSRVAELLGANFAFPELVNDSLQFKRRAFAQFVQGAQVAVVEDIFHSGQTTRQAIELVQKAGCKVVVVVCIWNRSPQGQNNVLGVPLRAVVSKPLRSWTAEECQQDGPCSRKIPVNRKPGHGAAFERLVLAGSVSFRPGLQPTFVD